LLLERLTRPPSWVRVAWRYKKESFSEFMYLFIFGLMPVWLGVILNFIRGNSLSNYLMNYLTSGEALLICATSIGPLAYLILKGYHKQTDGFSIPFPGGLFLMAAISIICLISAGILAFRTEVVTLTEVSQASLWSVSTLITLSSLMVWFAVATIKNLLEDGAPKMMRQDTADFVEAWKK
jgi:hypothetical protein